MSDYYEKLMTLCGVDPKVPMLLDKVKNIDRLISLKCPTPSEKLTRSRNCIAIDISCRQLEVNGDRQALVKHSQLSSDDYKKELIFVKNLTNLKWNSHFESKLAIKFGDKMKDDALRLFKHFLKCNEKILTIFDENLFVCASVAALLSKKSFKDEKSCLVELSDHSTAQFLNAVTTMTSFYSRYKQDIDMHEPTSNQSSSADSKPLVANAPLQIVPPQNTTAHSIHSEKQPTNRERSRVSATNKHLQKLGIDARAMPALLEEDKKQSEKTAGTKRKAYELWRDSMLQRFADKQ